MENFHFLMFNDKSKLFKKKKHNVVTTKEMRIWNNKRFVLRNKEFIIYKRDDRNWNF